MTDEDEGRGGWDGTVVARRCWRWPGRGQRSRPHPCHADGPCREEAVWGGTPGHAGSAGRHCLPHAAQQPGILTQGQRPHHSRGLPGTAGRPLRGEATRRQGPRGHPGVSLTPSITVSPCLSPAVPAHEAEAAVHSQRGQPTARGPARVTQEQPQQPGRAGPGGAAPGWAGPVPVLLPPAAIPQPPHEVLGGDSGDLGERDTWDGGVGRDTWSERGTAVGSEQGLLRGGVCVSRRRVTSC